MDYVLRKHRKYISDLLSELRPINTSNNEVTNSLNEWIHVTPIVIMVLKFWDQEEIDYNN